MAPNPTLRNSTTPIRPTTTPRPSLQEQAARIIAQRSRSRAPEVRPVRTVLPRHLYVEAVDLEKYCNDDPLVGSRGAAIILGVSIDALKKWRQRGRGPAYYQYEEGGPTLYSVNALKSFKAAHLITPRKERK